MAGPVSDVAASAVTTSKAPGDEEPGHATHQRLRLDVAIDDDMAVPSDSAAGWIAAAKAAANALSVHKGLIETDATASLLITKNARVQALNASYRNKDKPTNVLSFPTPAGFATAPGSAEHVGDIVIAEGVLQREAREQGILVIHHLQHLVIHGLLHLLDYDHERGADEAEAMEALEVQALARIGVANPYANTTPVSPGQTT